MLDAPRRFSATSAAIDNGQKALQTVKPKDLLPEFISKILFYPIQGIIPEASTHKRTYGTSTYGLVGGLLTLGKLPQDPPNAAGSFGFLPGCQEQSLPINRCAGRRREIRSRRAGVYSPLVGADSPRRPPHRAKIPRPGSGAIDHGPRCYRRRPGGGHSAGDAAACGIQQGIEDCRQSVQTGGAHHHGDLVTVRPVSLIVIGTAHMFSRCRARLYT